MFFTAANCFKFDVTVEGTTMYLYMHKIYKIILFVSVFFAQRQEL